MNDGCAAALPEVGKSMVPSSWPAAGDAQRAIAASASPAETHVRTLE